MARLPPNKQILAIVTAVLVLYGLSHVIRSVPSSNPAVVYVDTVTNEIVPNFQPKHPVSDDKEPIKDFAHEAAAAKAQVGGEPKDVKTPEELKQEAESLVKQIGDKLEGVPGTDGLAEKIEEAGTDVAKDPQEKAKSKPNGKNVVLTEEQEAEKVKATFVTLARNQELYDLIESIRGVEDRFNHRYHYDWVFLNDEEFTQEFKDLTSAICSGKTKYGKIPKEHWSYPEWIDLDKAAESRKIMKEKKIIYGDSESYRHMCRFESGFFWQNELLDEYEWYWRVEPNIHIHCDLNYDLFKFMQDNNKVYGFTISIHEFRATIESLWDRTKEFISEHPDYVAENNLLDFISDDHGETYNLCHFWSNFEVGSLNFWRSQPYREYFDYLDKSGGFFYERWGDAPIHSIAAALFLNRDQIHYFEDVGYNHGVYTQCPLNAEFRYEHKCRCSPDKDFTFRGYSCGIKYYDVMGLEKPKEWSDYT